MHLGAGELPEAFEGEERSVAGVGDVMHLVSGQQLLGMVRERQDLRLSGVQKDCSRLFSLMLGQEAHSYSMGKHHAANLGPSPVHMHQAPRA